MPGGAVVGCASCAAAASSTSGYAVIGDPSPAPLMAAAGAPGYAVVGGGAEPAPIGVMRAGYHAQGTLGASVAAQGGGPALGPGGIPYATPSDMPPSLFQQSPPKRHRILSHLLVPELGRVRAEREAKERASHAAISYGAQNAPPSALPPSLVFGDGH